MKPTIKKQISILANLVGGEPADGFMDQNEVIESITEFVSVLLDSIEEEIQALKPVAHLEVRNGAWMITQDDALAIIRSYREKK